MLKNKKIIYFYVSGRKNRIESNTTGSKEFFYGSKYLNQTNKVEIIEFNDNLPKSKVTINIFFCIMSLLMAQDHNPMSFYTCQSTNNRRIITKQTITVQWNKLIT